MIYRFLNSPMNSEFFIQRKKRKNLVPYSPLFNSSAQCQRTYGVHNERERMGNTMRRNVWGGRGQGTNGGHNQGERMRWTRIGN